MRRRAKSRVTPILSYAEVKNLMLIFRYRVETEALVLEMIEEHYSSLMMRDDEFADFFYGCFSNVFSKEWAKSSQIYEEYEKTYARIPHRHFRDSFDLFLLSYLNKNIINKIKKFDGGGCIY